MGWRWVVVGAGSPGSRDSQNKSGGDFYIDKKMMRRFIRPFKGEVVVEFGAVDETDVAEGNFFQCGGVGEEELGKGCLVADHTGELDGVEVGPVRTNCG